MSGAPSRLLTTVALLLVVLTLVALAKKGHVSPEGFGRPGAALAAPR